MSAGAMRWLAGVAFVACIAGLIVSSVNDNNGAAVTFGLIAVSAAVVLLAVTAVTTGRIPPWATSAGDRPNAAAVSGTRPARAEPAASGSRAPDEAEAAALEASVQALVAHGADETEVRDLVRAAVRLGRASRQP